MDAKLAAQVRDVSKGIALFDVFVVIVLAVTGNFGMPIVTSVIFGSLVAMLNFRLLAMNIEQSLSPEVSSKFKSQLKSSFGYVTRMAICVGVLFVSVKASHLNVLGSALGLVSPQFVIFIKKLLIDKFTERRSRA
ncbi:ATP synthase subunit I [Metaclostridioides mangenotii]|uniref:ATP synthase subunit I n=1 Tax=Metaclostridioides mangenotii TaxID=1540 RepID=UPI0004849F73|nr:ATP synthase subunit I [Clostridioides mangenotii]